MMGIGPSTFETVSKVDDNVFVGGFLAAADPALVRRLGFSRIVKLFADAPLPGWTHRHNVKCLVFEFDDVPDADLVAVLRRAIPFIRDGVARGERVLVHCHAGISRSVSVVAVYLMLRYRVRLAD